MLQRNVVLWSLAVAAPLAFGAALSCGGGSGSPPSPPPTSPTQAQLLQSAGRCAVNLYESVAQAASSLDAAVAAFAGDASPQNRDAARKAWEAAVDLWQQAEVFQFGPAAASSLPGGKGLRDIIYAWPLVSRCAVEQAIVSQAYAGPGFAAGAPANTRGLAALEYLLFFEDASNACAPTAAINAEGSWAAIAAELPARKAAYARAAAADVAQKARELADAWSPSGGNFAAELATAGAGSATFASGQAALNAINNALFYVEVEVRDQKLAIPLAYSATRGCATPVNGICPGTLESPFAGRSQRHVRNNLVGFRKLFLGCDDEAGSGVGFDDLLSSTGASGAQLASLMAERLSASFAALDALPEGAMVDASLPSQKAQVEKVFRDLGDLVSLMDSQFLAVLDLEPPLRAEGDND